MPLHPLPAPSLSPKTVIRSRLSLSRGISLGRYLSFDRLIQAWVPEYPLSRPSPQCGLSMVEMVGCRIVQVCCRKFLRQVGLFLSDSI